MAAMTLAEKILPPRITIPSKTMDNTLLNRKTVYSNIKHYDETIILDKLPITRVKSLIANIRKSTREDMKYLKSNEITISNNHRLKSVISALGYVIDNDAFFRSIETYVIDECMLLTEAIQKTVEDYESTISKISENEKDPLFPILIMDQLGCIEDRLYSHARRLLFTEFSKSIDKKKIIIIPMFFKEIFFDFNPNIEGLIYRKPSQDPAIIHYSVHYQIPIIQSDIEFKDRQKIAITTQDSNIIKNPTKKFVERYLSTKKQDIAISTDQAIVFHNTFRLFATISNPKDVFKVADNPWFYGVMYYPEYVLAAKGSPLIIDEWMKIIQDINACTKDKTIIFRLPSYNHWIMADDFQESHADPENLSNSPVYLTNYLAAIANILKNEDKTIGFLVSQVKESNDLDHYLYLIESTLKEHGYMKEYRTAFEFSVQETMYDFKPFINTDFCVYNVDDLATDYIINFRHYYDHLNYKLYKKSHLHHDMSINRYAIRRAFVYPTHLIAGYTITNKMIFEQIVNGQHRAIGIHPNFLETLFPFFIKRINNIGASRGLYAKNMKRQRFYEELRKKLGPDAQIKQGTYKEDEDESDEF